jgi:hypothetical protein
MAVMAVTVLVLGDRTTGAPVDRFPYDFAPAESPRKQVVSS